MMKKRKNVQFFAAAALTAALVTGQFSFATVMGDNTASVQVSSLIPDNVTIDQPVPLSDISLPKSDYGTLSWADGSCVPSARTQSYEVVFRPYNKEDLTKISGWDGQSDAIYSSVTVVVSSISKDSDYEGSQEAQSEQKYTESVDTAQKTDENVEDNIAEDNTEDTKAEEAPEITEGLDTAENTENSEETEENTTENSEETKETETPAEDTETPEKDTDAIETPSADQGEVPSEDKSSSDEAKNSAEDADATDTSVTETPEATVTPEADKDNIFDGTEKEIVADDRVQSVEENADPSDEEKAQIAETNHTCNGISVSGINLPWYVQFRVASGENYEFTNEAEANVFKSYEFELWDLKNDTEYEIPDGEYLSVTVPVKAGYDYTIEHLLDSGAMETIVPSVEGSTMVFSTHSFSPFGIAGSKALVGEEIEDGSYSTGTTSDATATPTVATTTSTDNTANSSSTGSTEDTSVQSSSVNQNTSADSEDQSEADNSSNSVGAVETGDNTPILPFVIIGIAAAVIVAALVYLKKKK